MLLPTFRLRHGHGRGCGARERAGVTVATPRFRCVACHRGGSTWTGPCRPPRGSLRASTPVRKGHWTPGTPASRSWSAMPNSPTANRSANGSSAASKRRSTVRIHRKGERVAEGRTVAGGVGGGADEGISIGAFGWPLADRSPRKRLSVVAGQPHRLHVRSKHHGLENSGRQLLFGPEAHKMGRLLFGQVSSNTTSASHFPKPRGCFFNILLP